MPATADVELIRSTLDADRPWAAYALGDLEPGFFEHCRWWFTHRPTPSIALFYEGFGTPILFAVGSHEAVAALLDEAPAPPELYLHVRPEILPVVRRRYRVDAPKAMLRMRLEPGAFRPVPPTRFERLSPSHADALERLYFDRQAAGEAPGFYTPSMLTDGTYFGRWEGGDLVAVAGTHLTAPRESVAAIGNVFTRRDRRGRGLGAAATSAVVGELLARRMSTIVLSVEDRNTPAIRIYERLGFRLHCRFVEGGAVLA